MACWMARAPPPLLLLFLLAPMPRRQASINCNPPAIVGFKNIGEVYKKPTLTNIPYFDGDNWPDMIEDVLK